MYKCTYLSLVWKKSNLKAIKSLKWRGFRACIARDCGARYICFFLQFFFLCLMIMMKSRVSVDWFSLALLCFCTSVQMWAYLWFFCVFVRVSYVSVVRFQSLICRFEINFFPFWNWERSCGLSNNEKSTIHRHKKRWKEIIIFSTSLSLDCQISFVDDFFREFTCKFWCWLLAASNWL